MNRWYGALTAPEAAARFTPDSVLCLPIGAYEQHGPYLPLHTDTIIAATATNTTYGHYPQYRTVFPWTMPGRQAQYRCTFAYSPTC